MHQEIQYTILPLSEQQQILSQRLIDAYRIAIEKGTAEIVFLAGESQLKEALSLAREQFRLFDSDDSYIEQLLVHERQHYQAGLEVFLDDGNVLGFYAVSISHGKNGFSIRPEIIWRDFSGDESDARHLWFLQQMIKVISAATDLSTDDVGFLKEHSHLLDQQTLKKLTHVL